MVAWMALAMTDTPAMFVEVVYREHGILAVNKPIGMDVFNSRSWLTGLPRLIDVVYEEYPYARVLNRIDRDASGIVIFAETPEMSSYLAKLWHVGTNPEYRGKRRKIYAAWVSPPVGPEPILCDTQLVTQRTGEHRYGPAETLITPVDNHDPQLVTAELVKHGRTHQIRQHLSLHGSPIVGDTMYGGIPADRMRLHAWKSWVHYPAVDGGIWIVAGKPEWGLEGPEPIKVLPVYPIPKIRPTVGYRGGVKRPWDIPWQEWCLIRPDRYERPPETVAR